jgi:hypothetical protein
MKTHDFHLFTQVFPTAAAVDTSAAACARPDGEPIATIILGDEFVPWYPGKDQIPVALMPHLGIGPAYGAISNPETLETRLGRRFLGTLHLQAKLDRIYTARLPNNSGTRVEIKGRLKINSISFKRPSQCRRL